MCLSTAERVTKRFLLRFSYIGTRYKGLQRQSPRSVDVLEHSTIQAALENALNSVPRLQYPSSVVLSSRTDKHVHAHANRGHVDLTPLPGYAISPIAVTQRVNRYLHKAGHEIVLRETIPVPYWYHCRAQAHRRKYVYRLGVRKIPTNHIASEKLPLSHQQTCLLVDQKLDLEKVQQVCELFEGFHDFETFQTKSIQVSDTRKNLEEITFVPDHDSGSLCEFSEQYTWWKFNVVASSFLYKQVRRMISAALSVGRDDLTLEQVSNMLITPHEHPWSSKIRLQRGHGLCLADIEYDTNLFRTDIPPPAWRPGRLFVGKHGSITSRSAHQIEVDESRSGNQ